MCFDLINLRIQIKPNESTESYKITKIDNHRKAFVCTVSYSLGDMNRIKYHNIFNHTPLSMLRSCGGEDCRCCFDVSMDGSWQTEDVQTDFHFRIFKNFISSHICLEKSTVDAHSLIIWKLCRTSPGVCGAGLHRPGQGLGEVLREPPSLRKGRKHELLHVQHLQLPAGTNSHQEIRISFTGQACLCLPGVSPVHRNFKKLHVRLKNKREIQQKRKTKN